MGQTSSLQYEESLVSSNLNSKLFWFHSAHPKFYIPKSFSFLHINVLKSPQFTWTQSNYDNSKGQLIL